MAPGVATIERDVERPAAHQERGERVGALPAEQGRSPRQATVVDSLVVIESRAAALAAPPSGSNDLNWPIRDGKITKDHIHAELGEIVAGSRPGRANDAQLTLYKSVGVAVEDAAATALVLRLAKERGVGREIEL